jgi:pimeloyl-ACP methyl ester carboxylesterase
MVDPIRRKLLKTGAAVAAMAATPSVFAQQTGNGESGRFYQQGNVRIRYEETGSGFPLLLIAGGGLSGSTIEGLRAGNPFHAIDVFKGEFRCIYADLRNSAGQSTGPVEVDRPWDAYTDDHIGVMDHLGIDKFMVLGFCIAGPLIWNLVKRAPNRVVAAVPAQPVGFRAERPNGMYESQITAWAAPLIKRRPDITSDMTGSHRPEAPAPTTTTSATRSHRVTCCAAVSVCSVATPPRAVAPTPSVAPSLMNRLRVTRGLVWFLISRSFRWRGALLRHGG